MENELAAAILTLAQLLFQPVESIFGHMVGVTHADMSDASSSLLKKEILILSKPIGQGTTNQRNVTSVISSLSIMILRGINMAAKFALSIFIARFIGLDALGVYGLVAGVALFCTILFGFGMIARIGRLAVTATSQELTKMLRPALIIVGITYLFLLILSSIFGLLTKNLYLVWAVFFIVFFEHLNSNAFTILNYLGKQLTANFIFLIGASSWIIFFIPTAYLVTELRTIPTLLAFWAAGQSIALFSAFLVARRWDWKKSSEKEDLKSWFKSQIKESKILYANAITNTSSLYIDRFLIGAILGLELAGVYVLFWSLSNALGNFVRMGVIAFSKPKLIIAHKSKKPEFWEIATREKEKAFFSSLILGLLSAFLMSIVVQFIEKPLAEENISVLWIILCTFVLLMTYEVDAAILFSLNNDSLILKSNLVVLATLITCNVMLMPLCGIWGAAIAGLAACVFGVFIRRKHIVMCHSLFPSPEIGSA